jgi:hypothetical protein
VNPPSPFPFSETRNSIWLALSGLPSPFCQGKTKQVFGFVVSKENTQGSGNTEMNVRRSFEEKYEAWRAKFRAGNIVVARNAAVRPRETLVNWEVWDLDLGLSLGAGPYRRCLL